ncbi:metallophosphoesterase [Novosphingobium aerophilum]|uniref:metallophosphoesterase n=1 Tax=Novosphingobium aerophilum TaxID=2839843 RepID=UPI0012C0A4FE|nr:MULTISPECIES: metallophosphoesterase [unclassified Novosphingobium]MPS69974.1 serine/threonine protein phosphatase [Novosphingobium sp.]WRT92343.1 metallophosphoesterase [Novosphingobium sp. RL4]
MLAKIRNLLSRPAEVRLPHIPPGQRAYAVGDIHGRLDLFEQLIDAIERDNAGRDSSQSIVVLLGDLIDRGPASAGVIARARQWASKRRVEFIQGNHEEMLLVAARKLDAFRSFLKFGGRETILSYGLDPAFVMEAELEDLQRAMIEVIPQDDFDFIDSFQKMVRLGDYLFVHAGIRPDTPLEHQLGHDCRWIREPFLSHNGEFGAFIVHGHTITEEPEMRANRVGIDTGAYVHGRLTAIGLQGSERWFIQACENESGISVQVAA